MAIVNLNDDQYCKILSSRPTYKGGESKLYAFVDRDGDYKLFKMFLFNFEDERKTKEEMIKKVYERAFSENIKIYDLVYYDNTFLGYIMNLKLNSRKLSQYNDLPEAEKLLFLKSLRNELDQFHDRGVVYGDIKEDNIQVSNRKNNYDVCFSDIDNVFIDDMKPSWIRTDIKKYIDQVGYVDFKLDSYMFNLLTMRFLNMNSKELSCKEEEINKIKSEMNNLDSNYSGEYIVDNISIKNRGVVK